MGDLVAGKNFLGQKLQLFDKKNFKLFDKNYEEKILVFPDTHYNMSFAEDRTEAYLENPKYSLIYTIFFSKSGYFLL